jgi:hypothetical protein
MPIFHWFLEHGLDLLNALGVVGGLLFTGYSLHSEIHTRRISNLLILTQSHRDVWRELIRDSRLQRILQPHPDLENQPITPEEEVFVNLVIQHLSIVFHTLRDDLTIPPEGLRRDVWQFFSLPIPEAVWNKVKVLQNDAFVAYVESCRNWK